MKRFAKIVLGILVFLLLIFGANELEIFGTRFWGVRKADAKREVFEQSQSYVEGKRQELVKYHHEWMLADDKDKKAIESTIRLAFANFEIEQIKDQELYNFLRRIMNN